MFELPLTPSVHVFKHFRFSRCLECKTTSFTLRIIDTRNKHQNSSVTFRSRYQVFVFINKLHTTSFNRISTTQISIFTREHVPFSIRLLHSLTRLTLCDFGSFMYHFFRQFILAFNQDDKSNSWHRVATNWNELKNSKSSICTAWFIELCFLWCLSLCKSSFSL